MRRPEQFAESVADMYVHGVSTRRVNKALEAMAGKKLRLSRSTVSRITERLREEYRAWKKRDLSGLKIAYLFIDAIRLGMRMQTARKEAVLIAYALRTAPSRRSPSALVTAKVTRSGASS